MARQVLYDQTLCSILTAHAVEKKLLLVYHPCHFNCGMAFPQNLLFVPDKVLKPSHVVQEQ